jgi:hypothetical protein
MLYPSCQAFYCGAKVVFSLANHFRDWDELQRRSRVAIPQSISLAIELMFRSGVMLIVATC